jgi:hypothetical protein
MKIVGSLPSCGAGAADLEQRGEIRRNGRGGGQRRIRSQPRRGDRGTQTRHRKHRLSDLREEPKAAVPKHANGIIELVDDLQHPLHTGHESRPAIQNRP